MHYDKSLPNAVVIFIRNQIQDLETDCRNILLFFLPEIYLMSCKTTWLDLDHGETNSIMRHIGRTLKADHCAFGDQTVESVSQSFERDCPKHCLYQRLA